MLLLYDSTCPHCQRFLPKFREEAEAIQQKLGKFNYATVNLRKESALVSDYLDKGLETLPYIAFYYGSHFSTHYTVGSDIDMALHWMDGKVLPSEDTEKSIKHIVSAVKAVIDPEELLY